MTHIEEFGSMGKSMTCKKTTCCDIYITVVYREDEPKKVDYIRLVASSKNGGCPVAFMEALADTLTFSVRRIRTEHDARSIVKNLRYHKCLQCPPNKDHTTSCSDAIGQVLGKVLNTDEKKEKE